MQACASLEDSNHCYFIEQNRVILRFHPLSCVSMFEVLFSSILERKLRFQRGGSAGTRTRNQRLKRALLYRLSYRPAAETLSNPDQSSSQGCRGRHSACQWTRQARRSP